jgi:hypothetical protein
MPLAGLYLYPLLYFALPPSTKATGCPAASSQNGGYKGRQAPGKVPAVPSSCGRLAGATA